jgi:hypothetical protein
MKKSPRLDMKNSDRMEVNIPFSGFYESLYSGAIDDFVERDADHYEEQDKAALAPELRLEAHDFAEAMNDALDYKKACKAIAESYTDAFSDIVGEHIGVKLDLKMNVMTSPAYYNFETDKIFASISWGTVKRLFAISKRDGHDTLGRTIERRHTSYDGFRSFYNNELETWLAKPLAGWDYHELGTLLRAVMDLKDWTRDDDLSLYYRVTDDGAYQEISDAIDWPKYEAAIDDIRRDKESELHALDPDYVPPAVRCPVTLDLFKPN